MIDTWSLRADEEGLGGGEMLNRSFRGREKGAAAASPGHRQQQQQQQQQQRGRSLGAVMKDKDEELTLFLEMRKRERERQQSLLLGNNATDDLDPPPGSKPGSSPLFKIVPSAPTRRTGPDDFLNSDSDKNDYDWLLTPPGTPLFPSLDKETQRSPIGHIGTPKSHPTLLKSRLASPQDPPARGNLVSRQPAVLPGTNSGIGNRRPSSSGPGSTSSRPATRPATPTGHPTFPVTSKPLRPSTPTSRATIPSKPVVPPQRSSTPAGRSSTPTSRPSIVAPNKVSSRSTTPARRPSTPSAVTNTPAPRARSTSVTRSATSTIKSSVPSRGTSPTVRSRPWKPSEMPGFSLDAPPNLRTSMPERPSSASRGRPGVPTSRSSSVEAGPSGRPRRQSCSPSRGRAPNGVVHSRSSIPAVSRSHVNDGDSVSPVLIGSKMVERVVNVRRLAPPRQDDRRSTYASSSGKLASSPDCSGFGRTLSKKSLDMALRHMDIRRSIPNSLRPLMTNIPASSMYSVRSGPTRNRTISVSDSPLATSSNASSEQSVSNKNILCLDGSELEDDDLGSEKGVRSSPAGLVAR